MVTKKKTTVKKKTTKKAVPKKKTTTKKVVKKSVSTKKVTTKKTTSVKKSKADRLNHVRITESGEIIEDEKVSKGVIHKSQGSSLVKNSRKGLEDEYGNWNGSTLSDDQIEEIKNPEEQKLAKEIDKLQEEIRRAREAGDDSYYIAGLVQDLSLKYKKINEINHKYLDF